ncbi:MAG: hypothetical protein ACOC33_03590 [bacterium]
MGVFTDILNNIDFKGNKANITIKVIIAISLFLISGAFFIGQFKTRHLDKLNDIENLAKQSLNKNIQLEKKFDSSIKALENKIDNVYIDGFKAFDEYRELNDKQLKMIIEYGDDNKELLKELIDIKSQEGSQKIKNNINIDTTSQRQVKINVKKIE